MNLITIRRDDRPGRGTVQLVTNENQDERIDITHLCSKLVYTTKHQNDYLIGRLSCADATACWEILKRLNHDNGLVSFLLIVEVVLDDKFPGKAETLEAVELKGCDETSLGFRYRWFDSVPG